MQQHREAEYRRALKHYLTEELQPKEKLACFADAKVIKGRQRGPKDLAALDACLLAYIANDGVTTIKRLYQQCLDDGLSVKATETGYKAVLRRVHHLLDNKLATREEVVDPTRRR